MLSCTAKILSLQFFSYFKLISKICKRNFILIYIIIYININILLTFIYFLVGAKGKLTLN